MTIVDENDEVMLVTANGICTRLKAGDISRQGRPATGVRAQNLVDNDVVVSVNKIVNPNTDDSSSSDAKATEETKPADDAVQTKLIDTDM